MDEICQVCGLPKEICVCQEIAKSGQKIRVTSETRRFKKNYTIISGFDENTDLQQIGKELKPLRDEGVLILGSGNIVHNIRYFSFDAEAEEPLAWAVAFDEKIKQLLLKGDHQGIWEFETLGEIARLSAPTPEHFLPLIYIVALQEKNEKVAFPVEGIAARGISMRGVMVG